jgi:hypothetical protein
MDKTTLVDGDLKGGREVIDELERRGIAIDVAAWLQDEDTGLWRLLLSSPRGDEVGSRPIYEVIQAILRDPKAPKLDLEDFLVASPHQSIVKDLRRRVATDRGFHEDEIRLDLLGLGGRGYRSSRIYRVVGDTVANDARVRVKANGRLGIVRNVIRTPGGPRYLVLYDMNRGDVRPLQEGEPPSEVGQDFGAQDLDFLYVARTGA